MQVTSVNPALVGLTFKAKPLSYKSEVCFGIRTLAHYKFAGVDKKIYEDVKGLGLNDLNQAVSIEVLGFSPIPTTAGEITRAILSLRHPDDSDAYNEDFSLWSHEKLWDRFGNPNSLVPKTTLNKFIADYKKSAPHILDNEQVKQKALKLFVDNPIAMNLVLKYAHAFNGSANIEGAIEQMYALLDMPTSTVFKALLATKRHLEKN